MSKFNEIMNKKAIALKYDEERNAAPVIVASGMGYMAERMVELANRNGVPVYEDNSLASALSQLSLGEEIPEELYQLIVDIYVYFLNYVPDKHQENMDEVKEIQENKRLNSENVMDKGENDDE